MELGDSERYALAALYTLAVHSTQIEAGVGSGVSDPDSVAAWGCPSEDLLDELLMGGAPLQLPPDQQARFWGHDCIAPTGLCCRVYAYLGIPRKAWPGLLRMPEVPGSSHGSSTALEAFVTLVRRYSAFLDPSLSFTTGAVDRLQQQTPSQLQPGDQLEDADEDEETESPLSRSSAAAGQVPGSNPPFATVVSAQLEVEPDGRVQLQLRPQQGGGGMQQVADAVAAAAAAGVGSTPQQQQEGARSVLEQQQQEGGGTAKPSPAQQHHQEEAGDAKLSPVEQQPQSPPPPPQEQQQPDKPQQQQHAQHDKPHQQQQQEQEQQEHAAELAGALQDLSGEVDQLPKQAAEGTVVPEATFAPAESYHHTSSHTAVLALYELIGGCLCSNTDDLVEDLRGGTGVLAALGDLPQGVGGSEAEEVGAGAHPRARNSSSSGGGLLSKLFAPSGSSSAAAAAGATTRDSYSGSSGGGRGGGAGGRGQAAPGSPVKGSNLKSNFKQGYGSPGRGTPRAAWFPDDEEFESGGNFNLAAAEDEEEDGSVLGGTAGRSKSSGSRSVAPKQQQQQQQAAASGGSSNTWSWWLSAGRSTPQQQQQQQPAGTGGRGGGGGGGVEEEEGGGGGAGYAPVGALAGAPSGFSLGAAEDGGQLLAGADDEDEEDVVGPLTKRTPSAAAAAAGGGGGGTSYQSLAEGCAVRVRWYDARARMAVKRVAHWLRVPWPKVCAFEQMWVMAALQLETTLQQQQQQQQQHPPKRNTLTYLKVGAAAVGGGALLALTGGLAAPAIAAGLGAAVTLVHGGAAAAAAVSGFAGSAVGTAAVTGVFGAWGASTAGNSAGALFSDIKEWGFWDISQSIYVEGDEAVQAANAAARGAGSSSSSPVRGAAGQLSTTSHSTTATSSSSSSSHPAGSHTPSGTPGSTSSSPSKAAGGKMGSWFKQQQQQSRYVPLLPVPVHPKRLDEPRMALTIAVSGCLSCMEDFVAPWRSLPARDCERFALVWESGALMEVNTALTSFLAQQAVQQVTQKTLQTFFYTGLVGALALPMALTTAIRVGFGSKWRVALRRAQLAGKMLAVSLLQGYHGDRPVTLVGCSMGARAIFHCLLELHRQGARGLVEHAVLLGTPVSCRPDRWSAARAVVAGRLINGYSVNDWTLGLLYRAHSSSSIWLQAAGNWKVEVAGLENVNLSKLVAGHQDYLEQMEDILEVLNLHC